MEYCIRSMNILELSAFLKHIEQYLRKIRDPPKDIMSFLEEIRSLGRVKSKVLSRGLVRS